MKDILKNLGLIVILIGVIFLSIVVFNQSHNNAQLAISLILVIVGLLGHIIINKIVD